MNYEEEISKVESYIKSLFKEIIKLESMKEDNQEYLFDRFLHLIRLYIKDEIQLYYTQEVKK